MEQAEYNRRLQNWSIFQEKIINTFISYQIPIITLQRETPREAVCLVFEKVNTGGVTLTAFELLTATFAVDNYRLRDDWDKRRKELGQVELLSEISENDFLAATTLLSSWKRHQKDKSTVITCKKKDILKLTLAEWQENAPLIQDGFMKTAQFLREQKIFRSADIPYHTQLVPLATIFSILPEPKQQIREKLRKWFWAGIFGELYGSATETRFARDIVEIFEWIDGGNEPSTVLESSFAKDRLLKLKTRNSAAYKGLYTLMISEGAKDFRTGVSIDAQTYIDEAVDIHHIFPKKVCEEMKIDDDHMNCIVNKAPISAKTNRLIGAKRPSEYLKFLEKENKDLSETLKSHFIERQYLDADNFDDFFNYRSKKLLELIEKATGKQII